MRRAIVTLALSLAGMVDVSILAAQFRALEPATAPAPLRRAVPRMEGRMSVLQALTRLADSAGVSLTVDPTLPQLALERDTRGLRGTIAQAIETLLDDVALTARVTPEGHIAVTPRAPAARALLIRGTLTAEVSGTPVPGAVLFLLDQADSVRSQVLSSPDGTFAFSTAPGWYRVRVQRIGFRPTRTPEFEVRRDTSIALRMPSVPVPLDVIHARASRKCEVRPADGVAAAELWAQAKTALHAAAAVRENVSYRFEAVYHSRLQDGDHLIDMTMPEGDLSGSITWPTLAPALLREAGYVATDSGGNITFAAPDIDVLLSDYFEDDHCFRSGTVTGDSIALEFEPAQRRRHVEIAGTLWLDARTLALRHLTYRYTNVPYHRGRNGLAGGRVSFTELPGGGWITTHWETSMPLNALVVFAPRSDTIDMDTEAHRSFRTVRVTSGDIRSVWRDGVEIWARDDRLIRVSAHFDERGGGAPAAGAFIRIRGAAREATTDSAGTALLTGALEGQYLIEATTPVMELLRRPPTVHRVRVAQRVNPLTVQVESDLTAAIQTCGRQSRRLHELTGVLVGTIYRGSTPHPAKRVWVEWEGSVPRTAAPLRLLDPVGQSGRFVLCGVPRGRNLAVFVRESDDGAVIVTPARLDPNRVVGGVAIVLPNAP